MIKNQIRLCSVLFVLLFMIASIVWAAQLDPELVLDMRNAPMFPRHFRTTADALPSAVNQSGLTGLRMAGGGQFSKAAFQKILRHLHAKKMLVVDLRQESHGILNNNAISWYGLRNAFNTGKSPDQIEDDQSERLMMLEDQDVVIVTTILKKSSDGRIEKRKPVEYLVHRTLTEEELVTTLGHQYDRIYVQDFHPPADREVDRFVEAVGNVPTGQWIYFHCRAGTGRTTLFMTMYDMMHNAKKVSFADIIARQSALGGKDLTQLPPANSFKYRWAVERLKFIKQFYQYARKNQDHFKTSWTQWLKADHKR